MLIKINIKDGETADKILKKFKRKVEQSSILKDVKKKEFFIKPSTKKKLKARAAYARNRKKKFLNSNFLLK